jgi:enoyl-CoA hydratase/isomerase-like protein
MTLTGEELLARAALDDEDLAPPDRPLVVVDLTTGWSATDDALAALATVPAVLVGFGGDVSACPPAAGALDVVIDDRSALAAIEQTVTAAPLAAVALALLLRGSDRRTAEQALVAESATYSALQAGPELAVWRASRPVRSRPPETDVVRCTRDGSILTITLDRPDRHNAYSREMRDGLVAALRLALADPSLHVVLTGAGPSFSSGGDLDEFGTFPDPATAHRIRLTRSAAKLMARLGGRVEARVHGACLGAGVELAAFAGRVVARSDARFGLPEVPLGLIPGAGGTASLPPRIGRQRTALLALMAQPIDATTALRWGLVDEIAD